MSFLFPSSTITLEAALRDLAGGSAKARALAAHALGDVSDPTERRRAVEALLRALEDDRPEVRSEASASLGDLADASAIPQLVRRLDDGVAVGLPVGTDDDHVEPAGSGLPLAGVTFLEAPYGTREPRCAVGGRLAGPGPGVAIVNAHLTYAGAEQRRAQAAALARLGDASDHLPIVATFEAAPRA